jgi:hypothetical protein
LDEFLGVLHELRVFVDSIEPADSVLARHEVSALRESRSIRRRLDYTAFVISLYSAFERLVESLVWSHAELVASRSCYSELPLKLRETHLKKSGEILGRRLGEGRYEKLDEAEIVANLHACLSGDTSYRLNRAAVVHHDRNLRAGVITELLGALGIENAGSRARQAGPILEWFERSEGWDLEAESIPEKMIELRIEDLVSLRNQVAHGGGSPVELLAPEEMRARLEFLEAYSQALFVVLAGAWLEKFYVKTGAAHALGMPLEGPFQGKTIVVVKKPSCRLFAGQPLFGLLNGQVDRWGQIIELQVDDVIVDSVEEGSAGQEVGLRADFKLTKRMELFALAERDEAVWG